MARKARSMRLPPLPRNKKNHSSSKFGMWRNSPSTRTFKNYTISLSNSAFMTPMKHRSMPQMQAQPPNFPRHRAILLKKLKECRKKYKYNYNKK